MLTPGLRIRRQINPSSDLRSWLDGLGLIEEIEDKQGKTLLYIDDAAPIGDSAITNEIVYESTVAFVIFDNDNNVHYRTTSAQKAERALKGATVTFHTEIDVDDLPEAEAVDEDDSDLDIPDDPPKWPKAKH